ncbi:Uncharacterised protein [Pseudomonas taetrolens]|nr:Uncharacterised protein [Pseudomonas taetrolens]VEH50045.1 Uncharacterised protein [Pseudomonas taetrolens]
MVVMCLGQYKKFPVYLLSQFNQRNVPRPQSHVDAISIDIDYILGSFGNELVCPAVG